jgi:1-acyl-sn-glycerol-3-phosphate acyltransferase
LNQVLVAKHKKWADWIFHRYLNNLFRQHFYAIHLLDPVPDFKSDIPILLFPNHSSWWDGFFIYLLNKKCLHRKTYLMMLEEQLKQNRFFRFLGVYSIRSDSIKHIKQSLQYTINLLNKKDKATMVCFFPQGELQPWHTKPIHLKRGLIFILERIEREIQLCFLSIRIEFLKEQRPEVFLQLSPIQPIQSPNSYALPELESQFNAFLDQLAKRIVDGEKGEIIFQGKHSVNERFHTHP